MKNFYSSKEWDTLKQYVLGLKTEARPMVFTNGCFDILHPGHIALLEYAKKQGKFVILGINSDSSVSKLKGEERPINTVFVRAKNLLDTHLVNAVVEYEEETPLNIINFFQPDVLIKGGDYSFNTIVGAKEVSEKGGKVLVFSLLPGYSTTKIINTRKNKETNQS